MSDTFNHNLCIASSSTSVKYCIWWFSDELITSYQHQGQFCPTGDLLAASGPRSLPIQSATTLHRTLFTDMCFAVISIYYL